MKFDSREEMRNYNREETEVIAVGKGEAGSKSANCFLRSYNFTERADFYITQIYAREDYYEQKNQVVLALEG